MPPLPSSAMASARRNSVLRPPLPFPFSMMVVSPPEISTQGGFSGWPRMAHCRAMPAWTSATSRDSPSIESLRMTGFTLGGFCVVRLEPVHHLLLVELGAHIQHGVGEAADDLGDRLRRQLVENADAHLDGLR